MACITFESITVSALIFSCRPLNAHASSPCSLLLIGRTEGGHSRARIRFQKIGQSALRGRHGSFSNSRVLDLLVQGGETL